jgi:hypothetical protein
MKWLWEEIKELLLIGKDHKKLFEIWRDTPLFWRIVFSGFLVKGPKAP